jgi:crotonobetainyl-CoA:carnitine CoA-transferase CaiB-like acyl-CoA transferase
VVGVNSQRLWEKLCRALGDAELKDDPRFAKKYARVDNRDALQARLEAILAHGTTEEWIARLLAEGVPCGRLNTIAEALHDPQIEARGLLVDVEGRKFPRAPMVMSKTPVEVKRGPPRIGQHTREVLAGAGLSEEEIGVLKGIGAIKVDGESA